jgi:hypothetical protein
LTVTQPEDLFSPICQRPACIEPVAGKHPLQTYEASAENKRVIRFRCLEVRKVGLEASIKKEAFDA